MATHRITTPEPGHDGPVGHVVFVNGVAELDEAAHAGELAYFRGAGYGVEELAEERDVDGDGVVDKLPRKNASEASWREFAVAHGVSREDADVMTRDELVAHFSKEEGK
jgi:hypothetical protein